MSEFGFGLAHKTPMKFSDDIYTPFEDIGMGSWSDGQIGEFFAGKTVIDIGSGAEGVERRLHHIFGNGADAPTVVNLNPHFTDWYMVDSRESGVLQSTPRYKQLDIEQNIRNLMEDAGEDVDGYMAQRIAVAGIVQNLEYPDGHFDIQVSTWAFPNVLYDCGGGEAYAAAGYREILRTQRRGGIALLAPIRPNEKLHVELDLERVGVPHNREFKPASTEGEVLELAVA